MKTFLANTIVMWYKRLGFAGALRWRILYWVYRLWPGLHIRDREWDFVLDYLPPLIKGQKARVLDVGATSSLFIYELARRGYDTWGLDIRSYQETLPEDIDFIRGDIRQFEGLFCLQGHVERKDFDFITCISVLEHIKKGQDEAIKGMVKALVPGGKLLLTIPTPVYAQGHDFNGFGYQQFIHNIASSYFYVAEYTERKGQICACLVRK